MIIHSHRHVQLMRTCMRSQVSAGPHMQRVFQHDQREEASGSRQHNERHQRDGGAQLLRLHYLLSRNTHIGLEAAVTHAWPLPHVPQQHDYICSVLSTAVALEAMLQYGINKNIDKHFNEGLYDAASEPAYILDSTVTCLLVRCKVTSPITAIIPSRRL